VEILEVRNLSKSFVAGKSVLRGIGFQVYRGEFLAIVGGSGAGKSTLLRCINRLIEPSGGEILVSPEPFALAGGGEKVDVLGMGSRELRLFRRRVGMIFQQFNIVKRLTVIENVLSGALGSQPWLRSSLRVFSRAEKMRALENLRRVGLLEHAYKRADELSGGEQQRVAIARTLMQEPVVILADEPVASLDPKLSRVVLEILRRICREDGITALVSLHTLEMTRQFSDRVVGLRQGEVVFDDLPEMLTDLSAETIYGDQPKI
jgi:phosphonate transport system ATP-binding protein